MGLEKGYLSNGRERIVDRHKMFGVYSNVATLEGNII